MNTNSPIAVVGIPCDENSSYLQGPARAPEAIRQALHCGSANLFSENGVDLGDGRLLLDRGDLELSPGSAAMGQIETAVATELEAGHRVLALGGDHAVTYPVVRAHAGSWPQLTVLHLDAHPDLYDHYEGNRYSNACPFARIMEEGLAGRLVQVGVRTFNDHQRRQARRFGVEAFEMRSWDPGVDLALDGPVYLSLDIDVLDPAFAPGVSHHEPGGMSTREVIDIIQRIPGPLVGADIVELNPSRDVNGVTAMVAAKLFKEIVARMAAGQAPAAD